MWHEQFEHQHVATTMEIGCLHSQDVENTVEMAASSSKMFQTARWNYRTGDPKKNPKRNLWYHLNISFIDVTSCEYLVSLKTIQKHNIVTTVTTLLLQFLQQQIFEYGGFFLNNSHCYHNKKRRGLQVAQQEFLDAEVRKPVGFLKFGVPWNGWFTMENPMKKWMMTGCSYEK